MSSVKYLQSDTDCLTAIEGVLNIVDGGVALLDSSALGNASRGQEGHCSGDNGS